MGLGAIRMKKGIVAVFLFTIFCVQGSALAAPDTQAQLAQTATPIAERNEKAAPSLPVSVVSEGSDSIGAKLLMRLKERFNQSSLFRLENDAEKDAPSLVLMLITEPEFRDRPRIGSVYSVCWVFKQGKGYLPFLLKHMAGIVNGEDIDELVDRLVERTDGIASRYGHLLKK